MLNLQQAQTALAAHANNVQITAQQIGELLQNKSTTFAQIVYCTVVATAAAHKDINIVKVVSANVQLFANILAATQVFANAVKRSAAKLATNDPAAVQQFTQQSNYFAHTEVYSVVAHKQTNALYLYAIYNAASSVYFVNGVVATKQQVAQYLTASAAAKLLAVSAPTHNVANNVTHNVKVRTIALANLVSITANKAQVSVA
jgi:hypothetical protein